MRSIEQLTAEILSLPESSRAILVDRLVESLDFNADPEIRFRWITEAKKRRDEVRDGTVKVISGEDALAQVRASLES